MFTNNKFTNFVEPPDIQRLLAAAQAAVEE